MVAGQGQKIESGVTCWSREFGLELLVLFFIVIRRSSGVKYSCWSNSDGVHLVVDETPKSSFLVIDDEDEVVMLTAVVAEEEEEELEPKIKVHNSGDKIVLSLSKLNGDRPIL